MIPSIFGGFDIRIAVILFLALKRESSGTPGFMQCPRKANSVKIMITAKMQRCRDPKFNARTLLHLSAFAVKLNFRRTTLIIQDQ